MDEKKKISVLIPCYNEVENVGPMADAIRDVFEKKLSQYTFELIFIDNASTDGTRERLRDICSGDRRVKAIFNVRNFGQNNSPYYGILQTNGDCTINMSCDFQDPVELIPEFIHEWESGYKIVCGVKTSSKENGFVYWFRSLYYKAFRKMSNIDMIEHFTGFGLYDRSFVEVLRRIDDPNPFLRGLIAEYGYGFKVIPFEQPERRAGKTHNNVMTLYSIAMRSFTNYTHMGIRAMSIVSFIGAIICIVLMLIYLIMKLSHWYDYENGMIPVLLIILMIGFCQLFFMGLIGEYLYNLKTKIERRPLVIEEERINFD